MKEILPKELHKAAGELAAYFMGSIGNYQRIDYGTGHEASFSMWMCSMTRLGLFKAEDYQALVTRLFVR